jgi:hypothetical protein
LVLTNNGNPSMENQEDANKSPTVRQMIHLQVSGEHSQEDLVSLLTQFQETLKDGGVIATPNNVVASVIQTTQDLTGMILTPKMTAIEIATVVVDVLNGFDVGQGNDASATFAELDDEAKLEILNRIQFVLRFGVLPPVLSEGEEQNRKRDAIFEAVTRSLGSKLTAPNTENLITVIRVAQKAGDEDFQINFKELVQGDIFKHGDDTFLARSNPYVNWIAQPLPVVTIDAELYKAPEPVAPEELKTSTRSKKKVQLKPSNSPARNRKK